MSSRTPSKKGPQKILVESLQLLAETLQICIQVHAFVQCCSDKEQLPELFVHLTTSCLLETKSADNRTSDHHFKNRAPRFVAPAHQGLNVLY